MIDIMTTDFKFAPYWWEAAPPVVCQPGKIEPSYDVAIVGSGYTGLSAAIALSRAGRSVAVFDKDYPGTGASRRSAGFIGRVLKKSFSDIAKRKGVDAAKSIYGELNDMYEATLDLISEEQIECYGTRCGRIIGATSPHHYDLLSDDLHRMRQELGFEFRMIPRSKLLEELASPVYCGAALIPDNASLHPGLYHQGLLERALAAGGQVFGQAEVIEIADRGGAGYTVTTSLGTTRTDHVVIGTNGYTPRHLGWYRRRLVPFPAYMAATEEIPAEVIRKCIPNNRAVIDSNNNIDFFRVAPDSPRILFGGATGARLNGPEAIAKRMKEILDRVLPELSGFRLSHVWDGYCAGTFDMMPHVGARGAIHHGMGYNFVGITTGTAFGRRIAANILGKSDGKSVFEAKTFPTIPLYTGTPWFLGLVMRYFEWQDRRIANGRSR